MILKSRCSRSSSSSLPSTLPFSLSLSISFSFFRSFFSHFPAHSPTIALFFSLIVYFLSPSLFLFFSLSFIVHVSPFRRFFSFSFSAHRRASLRFFFTISLALRGRYWGLRLRLSRGQRDRIVFRTIWLIECRWLDAPFHPSSLSPSPLVIAIIRVPTDVRKLYERVFKPRSRNRYLAKSGSR